MRRIAFITAMLIIAAPAQAQAPSEHWKTFTTPHFRIHYPAQYEPWAQRVASRMESVRDAVVNEVGYSPKTVTDILVMNPIAEANGLTLPLLQHPRIVFFTEPPEPLVVIGAYSDWINLLTVHETTHLIHMLRPSRNPVQRYLEHLLPLDPITLHGPRWVLEGYATVIEGRITGQGRPTSAIRAAILRKWAASGQLPAYSQLDGDRRFLGMSMAYLAGSAFLEWLEQRGGPDSLKHLWARMTARQKRSFESAFTGVFGDSPRHLYGLFTAELTERAKEALKDPSVEGDLWLETKRNSGDPDVSPDGSQIALIERNDKGESKLVVYSTGPNEEEKKYEERIAKMLKRDPEDVAPVRAKPVRRKAKHEFRPMEGGDIETPRWTTDGKSILYSHRQPDRDGFLHHDLFLWTPDSGENRRITHLADVRDAEPLPDGRNAAGFRYRYGWAEQVNVDLETGAVTSVSKPELDAVYPRPRGGFTLVSHDGFIDIARNGELVTRTAGVAKDPAPAPDGSLYFMSLEPDGYVLRHIEKPVPLAARTIDDPSKLVPAIPAAPTAPVAITSTDPGMPREYGIGRQERGLAFGGVWTAYDHRHEFGFRLGDVVGRLDTIGMVASGDDRGAAIASTWRGWPVALTAQAFRLPDKRGLEVRGEYEFNAPGFISRFTAGTSSRAFADARVGFIQRKTFEGVRFAVDSDHHAIGALTAAALIGDLGLRLTGEAGRHLTIGGFTSSVVPDSLRVERIDDPALPRGFAFSNRYRSARLDVISGGMTFFWRRYDLDRNVDVRGVELSVSAPPLAILKVAGFDLTLGAAKVSDVRGVKGWIGLRWRP